MDEALAENLASISAGDNALPWIAGMARSASRRFAASPARPASPMRGACGTGSYGNLDASRRRPRGRLPRSASTAPSNRAATWCQWLESTELGVLSGKVFSPCGIDHHPELSRGRLDGGFRPTYDRPSPR